jgi:hypothetical protein
MSKCQIICFYLDHNNDNVESCIRVSSSNIEIIVFFGVYVRIWHQPKHAQLRIPKKKLRKGNASVYCQCVLSVRASIKRLDKYVHAAFMSY